MFIPQKKYEYTRTWEEVHAFQSALWSTENSKAERMAEYRAAGGKILLAWEFDADFSLIIEDSDTNVNDGYESQYSYKLNLMVPYLEGEDPCTGFMTLEGNTEYFDWEHYTFKESMPGNPFEEAENELLAKYGLTKEDVDYYQGF